MQVPKRHLEAHNTWKNRTTRIAQTGTFQIEYVVKQDSYSWKRLEPKTMCVFTSHGTPQRNDI